MAELNSTNINGNLSVSGTIVASNMPIFTYNETTGELTITTK